jgi:hypothetical protein
VPDNQACTSAVECCSQTCSGNQCQPLNTTCQTAGNPCSADGGAANGCCSGLCRDGVCALNSSFCIQTGDVCVRDGDCCTGVCNMAAGAAAGTCAPIAASCSVDGTLCNGCGQCCSHFCGPFAPGGPSICQPASGCHVQGDTCHQDSDCCGGDPSSGLPGAGLIKCIPDPTNPTKIGTCGTPMASNCPPGDSSCTNACDPEGNVCHYKNTLVCQGGLTNVRNDCCACVSNKDCCVPDADGIPRCNALASCVAAGGACAYAGDCCSGPCVPDSTGSLHCGSACVAAGSGCTTNADCCTGLLCVVAPGQVGGTCGGSSGGAGGAGGGSDGGTPDAAVCAQYGQACGAATPCCNGVQCSYTGDFTACNGRSNCTCYTPVIVP